jgi:hypothetical protein
MDVEVPSSVHELIVTSRCTRAVLGRFAVDLIVTAVVQPITRHVGVAPAHD